MLVFVILYGAHYITKSLHASPGIILGTIAFPIHKVFCSIAPAFLDDSLVQNSVKVSGLVVVSVTFDED